MTDRSPMTQAVEHLRRQHRNGMSTRELEALTGISFSTLARILRGVGKAESISPRTRNALERWMAGKGRADEEWRKQYVKLAKRPLARFATDELLAELKRRVKE